MKATSHTWLRDASARIALVCVAGGGCGTAPVAAPAGSEVLTIDGSSTVSPVSEAVAELLLERGLGTRITVGASGTGGGLHKLCTGEIAIADASRPIAASEAAACAARGIAFVELPIGWDGVAVVVHPENTWARSITVAQLRTIWSPAAQGGPTTWRGVDPAWPDAPIRLFGAGTDSGTFDYFTKAIVGTEHSSRGDFTSSEDDNVLVQGVSADRNALGFMSLGYYSQSPGRMRLLAVDDGDPSNGDGPVLPSAQTIGDGTYQPLTRPVFLYVRADLASRSDVREFVHLLLGADGQALVGELGQVPLAPADRDAVRARFDAGVTGTMFPGGSTVAVDLQALLGAPPPVTP